MFISFKGCLFLKVIIRAIQPVIGKLLAVVYIIAAIFGSLYRPDGCGFQRPAIFAGLDFCFAFGGYAHGCKAFIAALMSANQADEIMVLAASASVRLYLRFLPKATSHKPPGFG